MSKDDDIQPREHEPVVPAQPMNGSTPWESVNPFSRPQLAGHDRGVNPLHGAGR
jgi:hypothetical protein